MHLLEEICQKRWDWEAQNPYHGCNGWRRCKPNLVVLPPGTGNHRKHIIFPENLVDLRREASVNAEPGFVSAVQNVAKSPEFEVVGSARPNEVGRGEDENMFQNQDLDFRRERYDAKQQFSIAYLTIAPWAKACGWAGRCARWLWIREE